MWGICTYTKFVHILIKWLYNGRIQHPTRWEKQMHLQTSNAMIIYHISKGMLRYLACNIQVRDESRHLAMPNSIHDVVGVTAINEMKLGPCCV